MHAQHDACSAVGSHEKTPGSEMSSRNKRCTCRTMSKTASDIHGGWPPPPAHLARCRRHRSGDHHRGNRGRLSPLPLKRHVTVPVMMLCDTHMLNESPRKFKHVECLVNTMLEVLDREAKHVIM